MKPGDEWRFLRMVLVLGLFVQLVYITLADYNYNEVLWKVLVYDANGWLHECAYVVALFGFFIWATFKAEERQIGITRKRKLKQGA